MGYVWDIYIYIHNPPKSIMYIDGVYMYLYSFIYIEP